MLLCAIYLTRSTPNYLFIDKLYKLKKYWNNHLTNSRKWYIIRPYQTKVVSKWKKDLKKSKKTLDKWSKVWYNKDKLRGLYLTCKYLENGKQYHFKRLFKKSVINDLSLAQRSIKNVSNNAIHKSFTNNHLTNGRKCDIIRP